MNKKKECVAMLLAGGQGSRLYALTTKTAKPAVSFGGKFRIIDFPLSNCTNSGIDTVGVLTQYQPLVLNDYIGNGLPWDLDRNFGGVKILPPYQGHLGADWYRGTANAIYQNLEFIDRYSPEYVAVLSGDHIYKMDYAKMLAFHKEKGADCTIAVIDVPLSEASRFGIMTLNESDRRITKFEEKPKNPTSTKASMGIYIFTYAKLVKYLMADEADKTSSNDFGKNILPKKLNVKLNRLIMKGLTVKEILRKNGYTVSAVADKLGISNQNLFSLLGKEDVKTSTLEKIAEVTGLPVALFYGDSHIHASVGDHSSAVTGNNINVNTTTGEFLAELEAQRRINEKSQEQIDRLLKIIENLSND